MIPWHRINIWSKALLSPQTLKALLVALGALWTLAEPTVFISSQFSQFVKDNYLWFVVAAVAYAAFDRHPKLKITQKLKGRDVSISIAIGNVFDYAGAMIIGTNTTFDTKLSPDLISERSVQGQFTNRYYTDHNDIDRAIDADLAKTPSETLDGERVGKKQRYEIGTVVRLMPKGKTAYLLAIAHINQHGRAGSGFEDLKIALAKLWIYLGARGGKESIVTPILGTGFGRITQPREEVVKEIIRSFVGACAEKVFCEDLIIVISPEDAARHSINLTMLQGFLSHICENTEFTSPSSPYSQVGVGTPISRSEEPSPFTRSSS